MSKKFVLLDSSVNDYGTRLIPSGVKLDRYKSNPVVLFCHEKDELPIGKATIELVGDVLICDIEFDQKDPEALKVEQKVEDGYLNAVSGAYDIISMSDDVSVMLPGQMIPTITESEIYEISLCSVPANKNSLKLRKPVSGITLSSPDDKDSISKLFPINSKNQNKKNMKPIALALGLDENASESEIISSINKIKLAKEAAEAIADKVIATGMESITDEGQKAFGLELAKTDKSAAINFIELNKKAPAAATTQTKVSDLIHKSEQATVELGKGNKECFDYLQKKAPQQLQLMKTSDPEKFAKIQEDYKNGVRYTE